MDLEPCPFCGSTDNEDSPWPRNRERTEWVCCCGNPTCAVRVYGPSPDEAARRWNRRATVQPDAAIPCSSCGQPATAHAVQNGGYVCPPNQPDAAHPNALAGEAGDARLGRIAMRFVDRAGDYCEVDPAERICDEFSKAMGDEIERQWREKMARDAATADNSGAAE